jgi:hypothetical protein
VPEGERPPGGVGPRFVDLGDELRAAVRLGQPHTLVEQHPADAPAAVPRVDGDVDERDGHVVQSGQDQP